MQLNNNEKILALEFIKNNENNDLSLSEIEKELKAKIYNYGEGVLFYFDENKLAGKVSVILELVDKLETTYINKVICLKDNKKVLKELINNSLALSNKYSAKKVLLGIRDNNLLKLAENIGLKISYSSFNMILDNREKVNDVLDKIRISKENIEEYVDVYNKSFMDMPHGTYIEIEDAKGYLENKNDNEDYFTVIEKNDIAYEMYKKRGFKVYNKLSDWI